MLNGDAPLNITKMEVDVRVDLTSDLSIEIYTRTGEYISVFDDRSAWDLVASTTGVKVTGRTGGVEVPEEDFKAVAVMAGEQRSFYITLQGNWLDYTAYALDQRGEVSFEGEHFTLYTGAGAKDDEFPSELDTVVDPQFAGIMYFDAATTDCQGQDQNPNILISEVPYDMLVSQELNRNLLSSIEALVDAAIETSLVEDNTLANYVRDHNLGRQDETTANVGISTGRCLCRMTILLLPPSRISTFLLFSILE